MEPVILNHETLYSDRVIAKKIKDEFLKHKDRFYLLSTEIKNCARNATVWLAISKFKELHGELRNEDFFGWMQDSAMRSISVDGVKISREGMGYLHSVLDDILDAKNKAILMKNSQIGKRFNELKDIILILNDWRNKRSAHLDDINIEPVSLNLQDVLNSLAKIDSSLNYISHYLVNPIYIIKNEFSCYKISDDHNENRFLKRNLESDPAIIQLKTIMGELNSNMG